ncbi:UDP-N-acetylmuramoyl-L-alanine--D-glutamate ligase [Peptoniphilus equinus]|uniref:UDP-N-acetylmuramoylalanine--D-glutamate ligase n=1 Tax=Peptoniphilus equinus TaxID=3016343 RepID=A0ABY7QTF0_9FIRM|nr:UDP-N-acetylmuramoyl-L-alanine--D-glutamate ligase [Peptoniphilus equinus]WBW49270.1 UDP-N-acetylmuramoyl-L-alanine--D-glutamate ligase [Peptoniphilus equinus]
MQHVLIIGMGITGRSMAKKLAEKGIRCFGFDDKDLAEGVAPFETFEATPVDAIIKSPGIRPDHPLILEGERLGLSVYSDLDIFGRYFQHTILAVTGTNGKTTTTSLIASILEQSHKAQAIGNIGVGVMDAIDSDNEMVVVECSSFQLAFSNSFHPNVAVITNISPDHLDWHGTFNNYRDAKLNVLSQLTEKDFCVLNYHDSELQSLDTSAKVVYFSLDDFGKNGAFIRDNTFCYRTGEAVEAIMSVKDVQLIGNHNLENILAAICAVKVLNVDNKDIEMALKAFEGVEHRLEYVTTKGGVAFYNDSKGTNPDSSIKAVSAFEKRLHLIAGGYQKYADYTELLEIAKGKLAGLYLIGETAPDIKKVADGLGIGNNMYANLEDAVLAAYHNSEAGDSILLSPACASWDMYESYEVRGRHFKRVVNNLED